MNFFLDTSRNLLVYQPPSPFHAHQILERIPEARAVNGEYVCVPHTLQNAQTLRWMQWPVAPVITDANYDWPAAPGIKPWESQKLTSNFLVLHPRSFVLSDMGTGKSLSALWGMDWLMSQHPPGTFRALVVAPLSILQRVWADGIFKHFLNRRTFRILHGDANKRLKLLAEPADVYIVNFDGVGIGAHTRGRFELDGFSKALAERDDIKLVIVDEASAYKDGQTRRHRIARQVIGKRPYCWMMTGTPTPNAPTDAHGLAKMINNAFNKSFTTFRNETMFKQGPFKWIPRKDGYEQARRLLTPSIRFEIEQVWDGPEMTTQQREVPLTPEQKKLLADLKRDLQVTIKTGVPITATGESAARQKYMQISVGAVYDAEHNVHHVDATPRLEELKAVIQEAPSKILCFAPLTSYVEILYREFKKHWSCEIVNGNTPQSKRNQIFADFQNSESPRIIVADPGTMAHGLDLWAAQTVIWAGITDKAELYAQANKRAHRPGQRFPVTIVQIVSNALEREIFRRLENNLSLQGALLDAVGRGDL